MRKIALATAVCMAVAMTGTVSAKKKPEDPNKRICRVEQGSASRIAQRRVCMTRAEWQEEDEARRRDADRSVNGSWDRGEQNAPRGSVPGSPGR